MSDLKDMENTSINYEDDLSLNTNSNDKGRRQPYIPDRNSDMYNRMKYYNSLTKTGFKIEPPAHVLPPNVFLPIVFYSPDEKEQTNKQSSIVTIFSLWNSMMGSTLLSLPWGFTQAGFIGGIVCVVLIGFITMYTAYLILKYSKGYEDFSDVCEVYIGKISQYVVGLASIIILIGALIAYYCLLSDSLFSIVNTIRGFAEHTAKPSPTKFWTRKYVPLYITAILFPLCNTKTINFLLKLNSFGVVSIITILSFILYTSIFSNGIHYTDKTPVFEASFPFFAGVLLVAFFIHNAIIPIMKNQKNPDNNARDLIIAFCLVIASYLLVGLFGYLSFYKPGKKDGGINQDFLLMFTDSNIFAFIARTALFLQLVSVFPTLCFIVRIQLFGLTLKKHYPGFFPVLVLNLCISGISIVFAMFYPHIGTILRFVGPISGIIYVFIFPITIHLMNIKERDGKLGWHSLHIGLIVLGFGALIYQFIP